MKLGQNLSPAEEAKLNKVGDAVARALELCVDHNASYDSQGRTRWKLNIGNKTGIGLLRTIERVLNEQVAEVATSLPPAYVWTELINGQPMVVPPGSKVVKNLLSGKECIIPSDTPLCCDPSSETYHSM